jgi:DNA adenine methylase
MILRRVGNKSKIAGKLKNYFPEHLIYVEPFFGAGGMFFNKQRAKHNIVNDLDSDVFNLFQVVTTQKKELEDAFYLMPLHSDLLDYWKKNKEEDPIRKALRFLLMSNYTYLGKQDTLLVNARRNDKDVFYSKIDLTFKLLENTKFTNYDFKKFFKSISFTDIDFGKPSRERDMTFIYADPPYLNTVDTYSDSLTWTEKDCTDLLDCLTEKKCKFAMSEFDNEFVLSEAKKRNLNIIVIGERHNLKNKRTEILITNYEKQKGLFD